MKLQIQSISDIITNSSSEIFCQIDGSEEVLMDIVEYLAQYIHGGLYDEDEIGMELNIDELDNKCILISNPYSGFPDDFVKAGLEAMLSHNFKNYTIKYDDLPY